MKAHELLQILKNMPDADVVISYPDQGFGDWRRTKDVKVLYAENHEIRLIVAESEEVEEWDVKADCWKPIKR